MLPVIPFNCFIQDHFQVSGHAVLYLGQTWAAPSHLVSDKSRVSVQSLPLLKDSYETGLEADILVVRLRLASLLKALLILAGSVIQQTIKKPGLTSLGNALLILAGSVIQQTIKIENFNYLNVAFISYKLTMWD